MKSRYNVFFTVISAVILSTGVISVALAQVQAAPQAAPVQVPAQAQTQAAPQQQTSVQQAVPVSIQQSEQAVEQALKASIENDFKNLLSFPLDEEKMVAYVNAARRVQRINDKWDVQIASTESNKAAIEYNNYSIEEIMLSLKKIPNLTLDQYNEMTRLISANKEFNRVYLAYKELVEKGRFEVENTPVDMPSASQQAPAPVQDVAPVSTQDTIQTKQ